MIFSGQTKEAIKTLQTAMTLVNKPKKTGSNALEFTRSDKVSLYLELADCYRLTGQNQEASRIMQEAMADYQVGNNFNWSTRYIWYHFAAMKS